MINVDSIAMALEQNKMSYNVTQSGYSDFDININYMGKSYRVEIYEEEQCLNLLGENLAINKKHKQRYHFIREFSGNNVIYNVLDFIKNKNITGLSKSWLTN